VRRTIATVTVLLAATLGLSACGENGVKVNFDKNGKEKACTALNSVKAEVGELTDANATVGSAQTRLADIEQNFFGLLHFAFCRLSGEHEQAWIVGTVGKSACARSDV
jgi:hypothetical protein